MGVASKSDRVTALRLGSLAWVLPGGAFFWPFLSILLLGGDGPWPKAFWLNLGPSLVLVAVAIIIFLKAARR